VSDTTPHAIDSIKSWRQIFETLDYEIKNFSDDSENKLRDIAESELHKVATPMTHDIQRYDQLGFREDRHANKKHFGQSRGRHRLFQTRAYTSNVQSVLLLMKFRPQMVTRIQHCQTVTRSSMDLN
jgi:hypothetical protein